MYHHLQKNTKRQTCKTTVCEKWIEENLDLELKLSGSIESVQNQIRLTLRLFNPQTKTLLQSKVGIFPEDQFEFQTNEMVKALFVGSFPHRLF
jgi:glutamine synthetase type III